MKVSIITVVYNGAKTIEQTILSVLGQTYKNIEYIIIDGQSTDDTQKIIEKYTDFISVYISEKDNGIYDAMNKGIQKATGEIIGIINSDDWYDRNAIENIVHFFEKGEADLVYGKICQIYSDGQKRIIPRVPLETIWYQMAIPHPSVFIKKKIYESFGLFNLNYELSADYDLLLRFYTKRVRFDFLDTVIAYFRTGGRSTLYRRKGFEEHAEISMKYIEESHQKEKLLPKFENWYTWAYFNMMIENEKEFLSKLICEYFHESLGKIIIYGTGIWGNRCYELLQHGKIEVIKFVDNNSAKWGQNFHDIKIVGPQELCHEKNYILIAVRYNGNEIKQCLHDLCDSHLEIVSLEELKILFNEKRCLSTSSSKP